MRKSRTSDSAKSGRQLRRHAETKDAKSRSAIEVTPEREAAVLTFVQRNHAELADLLAAI